MTTESYPISVLRGGERIAGSAELIEADDIARVIISAPGIKAEAEGSDYFEALQKVRRDLAARGLDVFCYGSSRDVYPSPMSRSMGLGLKAYRLTMGKQATGPLIDIFDSGPDIDLAPVDDQERYYGDWIASLGR